MPSGRPKEENSRPLYSSIHLNGHLLCAGDCETAGLDYKKHDLLQVAFVPLNPDLTPSNLLPFFELKLKPTRDFPKDDPKAKISKNVWIDHQMNGVEPDEAADMFADWFKSLQLPERKKIAILGANFDRFDRMFIMEWLGPLSYEHHFHQTRDVQQAALFLNDVADFECQPYPFPKQKLSFLCGRLGVVNEKPHDALSDAVATAGVYRAMMRQPLRVFKVLEEVNPEQLARRFHEAYERLAPDYGYKTREASAVPWDEVPEQNKKLMIATAQAVLEEGIENKS